MSADLRARIAEKLKWACGHFQDDPRQSAMQPATPARRPPAAPYAPATAEPGSRSQPGCGETAEGGTDEQRNATDGNEDG